MSKNIVKVTFGGLMNLASGRWKFPQGGVLYCYKLAHTLYFGLVGSHERYRMVNGPRIQKYKETVRQFGKPQEIWVDDPSWR